MRPIVSASDAEINAIKKALDKQRKENGGELDHRELLRRVKCDKKHPARPFVMLNAKRALQLYQEQCCQAIIRFVRVRYVDLDTGNTVDAPKYIGIPTERSKVHPDDHREVRYEDVQKYQEDEEKVRKVYLTAKEAFLELCKRYYHNRMMRPMCVAIRKIIEGKEERSTG